MRNLSLLASLLFILFGCEKPNPELEKSKVEAAVKGFYKAAENFDYEAMRTSCTATFHAIEDGHIYANLDEFFKMAKSLEGSKGQINMDFVQTNVVKDFAFLIIKFNAVWARDSSKFYFKTIENYILKKDNGKWLIDFWQSTYLPDEHDKKYRSIHFMIIPDKLPVSELSGFINKINDKISALGYPDCGYSLLKVIPEKDSKFNWVLEGSWKNPDVYAILHNNKEMKEIYTQGSKVLNQFFENQTYLKAVLP